MTGTVDPRSRCTVSEPLRATVSSLSSPGATALSSQELVPKQASRITIAADRISTTSTPPSTAPSAPSISRLIPRTATRPISVWPTRWSATSATGNTIA